MGRLVVVTGGSGQIGRYVIEQLLSHGHSVLNLDLMPGPNTVHTIKVDLTRSGDVYNALSSHFNLTEPLPVEPSLVPDAVVHLAGYARNMIVPDNETFQANVTSSYNIIDAACKLGIKKIICASSICVYGVTYANGDMDFASFPVNEATHVTPIDSYALSKRCTEVVAEGFARRFATDIYVLRIGRVVMPDEYKAVFASYVYEPRKWKVHGWSYVDARDLGRMCERSVLVDGLGFQIFNATNNEITNTRNAGELVAELCPHVALTRPLEEREAPITNRKIRELLGFREQHSWRTYYQADVEHVL
ncbi:hypothetical protein PISL3812_08076 [Talaromyces islandicus]|uniref:NAD-dependent epimerase/dehydratase domain-containing protein n=1 Tax=Talaromyces islandicus TaxID=28573 RepID=A0A0U1M5W1_TALIS|nr:hypothetical protein PISL3812_08076 [Talaromyces islandicus]